MLLLFVLHVLSFIFKNQGYHDVVLIAYYYFGSSLVGFGGEIGMLFEVEVSMLGSGLVFKYAWAEVEDEWLAPCDGLAVLLSFCDLHDFCSFYLFIPLSHFKNLIFKWFGSWAWRVYSFHPQLFGPICVLTIC